MEAEFARARGLLDAWEASWLRVRCRAEEEIEVPFTGSLIRGALEAALIGSGSTLLEGPARRPGARVARRGSPARPFALVPPERIRPGPVEFELKLFGLPCEALGELTEAIRAMGRDGIGRDRVPLPVESIEELEPRELELGGALPGRRRIALRLRTPLRLKEGGRIDSSFEPEQLARAALRRLAALGELQGQRWPRAWPATFASLGAMCIESRETRWLDWGRTSARQGRAMRLGGAVGRIACAGVPAALVGLLRAASWAQLGKNTAFGLGVVDLEELP